MTSLRRLHVKLNSNLKTGRTSVAYGYTHNTFHCLQRSRKKNLKNSLMHPVVREAVNLRTSVGGQPDDYVPGVYMIVREPFEGREGGGREGGLGRTVIGTPGRKQQRYKANYRLLAPTGDRQMLSIFSHQRAIGGTFSRWQAEADRATSTHRSQDGASRTKENTVRPFASQIRLRIIKM